MTIPYTGPAIDQAKQNPLKDEVERLRVENADLHQWVLELWFEFENTHVRCYSCRKWVGRQSGPDGDIEPELHKPDCPIAAILNLPKED